MVDVCDENGIFSTSVDGQGIYQNAKGETKGKDGVSDTITATKRSHQPFKRTIGSMKYHTTNVITSLVYLESLVDNNICITS